MKTQEELDDEIMEHGHVLQITKEEAIKQGAESMNKTVDEYTKKWDTLPCDGSCNYMYCQGWIAKPNKDFWR